ncbi:MAG TPA: phosphoribosyltransferase family protein [Bacteroidales bacterium]|nr:phosphoribosyltransferase family protein [Bacteroidales bacterium]
MVTFEYLFDYTPFFSGGANDHMSRILLSFKRNHESAFEFFRSVMLNFFDLSEIDRANTVVCYIPGHDGRLYHPVQRLCSAIAEGCGLIDGTHLVRKLYPTESFCRSGQRDPLALRDSIEIDGVIAGRHIILLDDIATTGTSFTVVSRLLTQAGARSVRCVALGRTIKLKQERGAYA